MGRRLVIRQGDVVVRHELGDEGLVIGRDFDCDIVLTDYKISRSHARVIPSEEGVRLVDLDSRNGCWVNEERVEERIITKEDTVRLGGTFITLEEDPPPEPVLAAGEEAVDYGEETVMLSDPGVGGGDSAVGEEGLVAGAAASAVEDTGVDEDGAGTVLLAASEADGGDSGAGDSGADEYDVGTVLLKAPGADEAGPGGAEEDDAGTVLLKAPGADEGASAEDAGEGTVLFTAPEADGGDSGAGDSGADEYDVGTVLFTAPETGAEAEDEGTVLFAAPKADLGDATVCLSPAEEGGTSSEDEGSATVLFGEGASPVGGAGEPSTSTSAPGEDETPDSSEKAGEEGGRSRFFGMKWLTFWKDKDS